MLYALGGNEGNGRLLASTVGFNSLMTAITNQLATRDPKEAEEMLQMLKNLKNRIEGDDPKSLSLQKVYEKWAARKEAGETLELAEVIGEGKHRGFELKYSSC